LILWARAMRRRRSAGLTYFFRPRGVVAALRDDLDFFFDETEDLFEVVPRLVVAECFLPDECAGVLGLCSVELAVPEPPETC
jgi:hypothetical protein